MAFFRQSQATMEGVLPCSSAHSLASGNGLVAECRVCVLPLAVCDVHGLVGSRVYNLALFVSRICAEKHSSPAALTRAQRHACLRAESMDSGKDPLLTL